MASINDAEILQNDVNYCKEGCLMEDQEQILKNNNEETIVMNKNYNYISDVLDKLLKKTETDGISWKELSEKYMLRKGPLDYDEVPVDEGVDPDYEDYEETELFHYTEDRPDTLVYEVGENGADCAILYRSPYHYGKCKVEGSAYKAILDNENELFLLKLSSDGKIYYELYLTELTRVEYDEEEDEEYEHDPSYCVEHNIEYIATSCDEAMHAKLAALYKAAAKVALLPHINESVKAILDKLL